MSETFPPRTCTYGKTYFRGEKLCEILQNGSKEEYVEVEEEEDSAESIVQVQEETDDETEASALQTEEDSEKQEVAAATCTLRRTKIHRPEIF